MPSTDLPPPPEKETAPKKRLRTRRRWWLALFVTLLISLPFYPPLWHRACRAFLIWQAGRVGCELTVARIEGGLFDTTEIYDLRVRQRGLPATSLLPAAATPLGGTDFRIARVDVTFAWHFPFTHHSPATWIGDLVLEGVSGRFDLTTKGTAKPANSANPGFALKAAGIFPEAFFAMPLRVFSDQVDAFSSKAIPARFRLTCDDVLVRRGRFWLHWRGGLLTGIRNEPGQFLARELGAGGPGYDNSLTDRHAQTFWKDNKLTFANLELRPTLILRDATLDFSHLDRRMLAWEAGLNALGGTVRGQGSMDFSRRRLGLDVACSFAGVQVRPLAKTLGIAGVSDGQVVQSSFTFRGDLEDWLAGEMWLNGNVTDFRWKQRRWENLDIRAIVLNRHLQVHELDLRQSRNHLSLSGECVLPPPVKPDANALPAAITEDWWRQAAFSCNIDARLDELQALSDLLEPQLPGLRGRMSANGTITARGGETHGFEGYLNVEGSDLSIRGAPLDYLHSTLLFHGEEMQVADFQATHAGDYFNGKGSVNILGAFRYQGELRASAKDLAVYAPAYQGLLIPQPVNGALQGEWSGDGTATAHSGAFRGTMERFYTSAGGGVMPRPVNLETEGTYSPVSLSVRQLTLVDGEGKDRHEVIKIEGAVPWNQDAAQWAAGHWMDFTRPMKLRAECHDAPLDVLAALVPAYIRAARGRVSGNLEAQDAWRAPLLNGALEIKDADFLWTDTTRVPLENVSASFRLEQSVLHVAECHGKRAGEMFSLQGTVDLHDTANPILDVSLAGKGTLRADDGRFTTGVEYSLKVEGEQQAGPVVKGEVNLSGGYLRRRLEFTAQPFPDAFDTAPRALLGAFADAFPKDLASARLDLHITSSGNLKLDEITAEGELTADLRLTGTWQAPQLAGSLALEKGKLFLPRTELNLTAAYLYFAEDRPVDDPTIWISATSPDTDENAGGSTSTPVFFFGARSAGMVTSSRARQDGDDVFTPAAIPKELSLTSTLSALQPTQAVAGADKILFPDPSPFLRPDSLYLQFR